MDKYQRYVAVVRVGLITYRQARVSTEAWSHDTDRNFKRVTPGFGKNFQYLRDLNVFSGILKRINMRCQGKLSLRVFTMSGDQIAVYLNNGVTEYGDLVYLELKEL